MKKGNFIATVKIRWFVMFLYDFFGMEFLYPFLYSVTIKPQLTPTETADKIKPMGDL